MFNFLIFYIRFPYVQAKPVSPDFVQQIIPNVYILPKDMTA